MGEIVIQWRIRFRRPSQMRLDNHICTAAHPGYVIVFAISSFSPLGMCAAITVGILRPETFAEIHLSSTETFANIVCSYIIIKQSVPVLPPPPTFYDDVPSLDKNKRGRS